MESLHTLASETPISSSDSPIEPSVSNEAYIHILSNDVLIQIFSSIFDEQSRKREDNMPLQYHLSLVCRQWRELIITTPLFWNAINLYPNTKYNPTLFFERSNPALIDLYFDATSNWAVDETTRLTDLIVAYFSRIRSFTIHTWNGLEMARVFRCLKDRAEETVNLTTLKILALLSDPMDVLIDTRTIQHLELSGIPFDGFQNSTLTNLTSLVLDSLDTDIRTFQNLFIGSPSLANLVIRQFRATTDVHSGINVDAPSLRRLAINIENDHGHDCTCVLSSLSAPNLEELEIVYLWAAFNTHHKAVLSHLKEFSNLHKLRICSHSIWLEADVSFLSSLPSTTELEIIEFPRAAPAHPKLSYILNLSNIKSITFDLNPPPKPRMSINLQNFSDIIQDKLPTLKCPVFIRSDSHESSLSGHHLYTMLGDSLTLLHGSGKTGILDTHVNIQALTGNPLIWQEESESESEDYDSPDFDFDYEDQFGEYDEADFENYGSINSDFEDYEIDSGGHNGQVDEYNDEQDEFEDPDDDYD